MALIKYKFSHPVINSNVSVPVTQEALDKEYLQDVLNAITLAIESGTIDDEKFVTQLFDSLPTFHAFARRLAEYDYRINDRWFQALAFIGNFEDGEGERSTTNEGIADALLESAEESMSEED